MNIVLENKGVKTDYFYVPPFVLGEGEVVVLFLSNGGYFYDTEMFLKDIFCDTTKRENVIIHKKMTFVEHFKESSFRRTFYPTTVGEYLRKNANLNDPFSKKIYEIEWITSKTKMNSLAGKPRRLLCLYAALSKTKDIVFDLVGVDPKGSDFIFKMVKKAIENGGSAILLDSFPDMKEHASKYIEVEWNKDMLPPVKEFKLNLNKNN
ncbi:hypothetical protein [Flavobacterium sp. Root420]|uniref:hypothetical protein n=1 Tax=Flavobacterium sp. Root420 TaxID=1736533 RepID=UPI0006F3BA03|nr:hypothetical protein [Flavobacterium sp. Root420]KQX15826.1 hypothetical protein ASC72_02845 [Flavobacterium sp. Root420]